MWLTEKPYALNAAEKECRACRTCLLMTAVLLTAPVTLPVAGVAWLVYRARECVRVRGYERMRAAVHGVMGDVIVLTPSDTLYGAGDRLALGAIIVRIDRYAPDKLDALAAYVRGHTTTVRVLNLTDAPELDTNMNMQIGDFYGNLNRRFTFEHIRI